MVFPHREPVEVLPLLEEVEPDEELDEEVELEAR